MTDYILAYYQKIEDGSITAGKFIRKWYKYIITGIQKKTFLYDAKKAEAAIAFIENFCHHHEGALAPGLLKLELWQKALISVIFGIIDPKTGFRQFQEIFVVVSRKNGKTLLASGIAEYMTYLDDYGARVYFCAPKLEQASLCFDAYFQSIEHEPELAQITKKRRTDIYVQETNSTGKPLAFSAKKSDGLNISCGICDEIAAWQGDQGLKFYEVLKSSMGARRQPLLLSITTAGYINDSIYDELFKRSTSVLNGTSHEKRLAPFLYIIDDVEKWNDLNELKKSNPNMGVSVTADFYINEIAIAESSLSKKREFLTKYCCIKQSSSLAWLDAPTIEKMYRKGALRLSAFERHYAVGGIDLSQTTDLTSACVIIERDGILYVFSHFWLPKNKIQEAQERDGIPYDIYIKKGFLTPSGDNFVDYHDCFNWFKMMIEKYHIYVLMTGYDRYSAQYLVQDMQQYGFQLDDVFQGDNLWGVIQETEGLIKDGKINIGNNDLLKAHFYNSAIKMSAERGRGRLVKVDTRDHIDGVAALLDAMTVRQKHYQEIGRQLQNTKFSRKNKAKEKKK